MTAAGGHGTAAVCDHRDDDHVRAVVSRIDKLDLLVNNVWAGYERLNAGAWLEWTAPVAYSVAKAADDRLAAATAAAFKNDGVASVALHPGLVRTEGVMQFAEHFDLTGS